MTTTTSTTQHKPAVTASDSDEPSLRSVETTLEYHLSAELGGTDEIWVGLVKALRVPRALVKTKVFDVRGHENDFSLSKQGFQWINRPAPLKTWDDDEEIRRVYFADCEALLKELTGASHAYAFQHVHRAESWNAIMKDIEKYKDDDLESRSANNRYIHCDRSYRGAEQLYDYFIVHGKREDLKPLTTHPRRHWAMYNLWRPCKTVNRDALCVADANSIRDDELVELTTRWLKAEELTEEQKANPGITRYGVGQPDTYLWAVKPPANPESHKWYYASRMEPDEVLVFNQYDSRQQGAVRRVPHTSFESALDHGPARESVEVRAFVFWEDEDE